MKNKVIQHSISIGTSCKLWPVSTLPRPPRGDGYKCCCGAMCGVRTQHFPAGIQRPAQNR